MTVLREYDKDKVIARSLLLEVQHAEALADRVEELSECISTKRLRGLAENLRDDARTAARRARTVEQAIAQIEGDAGKLIHLRYVEGRTMQEVASQMNYTPQHLYNIRKRAFVSLAEALSALTQT